LGNEGGTIKGISGRKSFELRESRLQRAVVNRIVTFLPEGRPMSGSEHPMSTIAQSLVAAVNGLRHKGVRSEPPQLTAIAWQARLHIARRPHGVFGTCRRFVA